MLDREQIKELVKSVYPNKKWATRVEQMSPQQLLAIVIKFREEGKL